MLIGRASERARVERLLAGARLGTSGVLVVSGDPGIGKTALIEHAAEHTDGMAVLRARGVPSEAEIPFAGPFALLVRERRRGARRGRDRRAALSIDRAGGRSVV